MLELDASIVVVMFFVVVLAWAVSRLFLRPIGEVLEERHKSTQGTMEEARQKRVLVEEDLRRYHQTIQQARAENYRRQEEHRRQSLDVRQQVLHGGRQEYERILAGARQDIVEQAARAKEWMAREADALCTQIVKKLLT